MTLETMKELFGITHVGEEEVPNVKRMHIGEDEVSLSQPITTAVPPEEEEVPVPQGPTLVVLSEEEQVLAPLVSWSHRRAPLSQSRWRKKSHRAPMLWSHQRKRRSQPPYRGPTRRKGMPCLGTALGKFFAFLFSQKRRRFFSPFFLIHTVDL
jgi:hypothetical protein